MNSRERPFECDTCGLPIGHWQEIAVLRAEDDSWFAITHAGECMLDMLEHLAAHSLVPTQVRRAG